MKQKRNDKQALWDDQRKRCVVPRTRAAIDDWLSKMMRARRVIVVRK